MIISKKWDEKVKLLCRSTIILTITSNQIRAHISRATNPLCLQTGLLTIISPYRNIRTMENKEIDFYTLRTEATGAYSGAEAYAYGDEDVPGIGNSRMGAKCEAGVGKARAVYSVLEAEAKGPSAGAGAEISATEVGAMARAEIGSVSAAAGPVKATLGLAVDTGIRAGADGLEVQFLGTGVTLGPNPSISFLGSKLECVVM
ncbi:uncharacterized protein LOC142250096 [Anomaloglossus baeobatrachus]|uniref:uncharacterized protein LOC142250096 n=1 Tax=Anomaloglossus baeobatrachus TaxID=238106 RepID=UPI003F506047